MAVASMPRNSTAGRKMNESDMASMLASRLARLTSSKRSCEASSWAKAWITRMPEMSSARSPTTAAIAGARLAEGHLGLPGEEPGGQHHQRQHAEGEQRQARAHGEHDHDDADQHQHVADQGDQALREQVVDHRHVVDDARDGHADDVGVVVAQRQRLQVAEQLAAQVAPAPAGPPRRAGTAGRDVAR